MVVADLEVVAMVAGVQAIRGRLRARDLRNLFVEELGWDRDRGRAERVTVGGVDWALTPVAEKRGFRVFVCGPGADGRVPEGALRAKIDHEVTKIAREHLIVFEDAGRAEQCWYWVKREQGESPRPRSEWFRQGESGQRLAEKLDRLRVEMAEEEALTVVGVAGKAKGAFDLDRVTKKFYERFQQEHKAFLAFIAGIKEQGDREWYASLMLNRLMFIYFMQRKGFLNGEADYLRTRLAAVQARRGRDQFHSFYRFFLKRLFHEGLNLPPDQRPADLEGLLGSVPYLNGGLFEEHQLELNHPELQIGDKAFEDLFQFFDSYDWHLDNRALRSDREINPDVLGYIFEKYINQKEMGAYYTKEDITEYIGKNTILPYLFDAARRDCAIAFVPEGALWRLLREDPDRYAYDAVKQGTERPLPPEIAAGLEEVGRREGWNRPAAEGYGLPTETWREHVARRRRWAEVRARLVAGEVASVDDLITYNLDIRQFARDAIETCEGADFLWAFYKAVRGVKVLDPTCGSGAFLFAALNILEPLYDFCLERMQGFVDDAERAGAGAATKHKHFRAELTRVAATGGGANGRTGERASAGQRKYFILKSIILGNLYGVDIMEEAVEICKLRLFLKLAAQVDPEASKPNLGLEPLPDIDFNIRAGNTLVGFATLEEVRAALARTGMQGRLPSAGFDPERDADLKRIEDRAHATNLIFAQFHHQQTEAGGHVAPADKAALRQQLAAQAADLDVYLAAEYGIRRGDLFSDAEYRKRFAAWRESHQPFHWFAEFYGIMRDGGFDVIIGNPPYVELSKVRSKYSLLAYHTNSTGNLYCPMVERSLQLEKRFGWLGMIVPMSLSCTERMANMREVLDKECSSVWLSHYSGDAHPSKLFEGVNARLDIVVTRRGKSPTYFSSAYLKWFSDERAHLFSKIEYTPVNSNLRHLGLIPKLGTGLLADILAKMLQHPALERSMGTQSEPIYVHRVITMFVKCFDFVPFFWNEKEGVKKSEDYKLYRFGSNQDAVVTLSILNSTAFFAYFIALGDCFHCEKEYVTTFPIGLNHIPIATKRSLSELGNSLIQDLRKNAVRKVASSKMTGRVEYDEFWPRYSKPIIDEIDRVLAQHYGLTDEELDFIINYDIKYRMGRDADGD